MDKLTKEQEGILRELAPYVDIMVDIYHKFLWSQISEGKDADESRSAAEMLAVTSGLSMSRNSSKITESVKNLLLVKEYFKKFISLKKMHELRIIEGRFEGVDEYGWPGFHVTRVNEFPIDWPRKETK